MAHTAADVSENAQTRHELNGLWKKVDEMGNIVNGNGKEGLRTALAVLNVKFDQSAKDISTVKDEVEDVRQSLKEIKPVVQALQSDLDTRKEYIKQRRASEWTLRVGVLLLVIEALYRSYLTGIVA